MCSMATAAPGGLRGARRCEIPGAESRGRLVGLWPAEPPGGRAVEHELSAAAARATTPTSVCCPASCGLCCQRAPAQAPVLLPPDGLAAGTGGVQTAGLRSSPHASGSRRGAPRPPLAANTSSAGPATPSCLLATLATACLLATVRRQWRWPGLVLLGANEHGTRQTPQRRRFRTAIHPAP